MSGIAAIIRFDGQDADPRMLDRMTDAIAYRGPDGTRHWTRGSVALGHCMMHSTAESLGETHPLLSEDGALALVMDGYLTNYDELRSDLLTRGAILRNRADSELVLRAYEIWGKDCPIHLQGEFAIIIWDERQRDVFCVRDHAALRPLTYHWDGKRLLVASDHIGLLAAGDFEARPNPDFITQMIGSDMLSRDETAWRGLLRLPAGMAMRVDARGCRINNYWTPPLEVSIRYASDEEYFEHYREVISQSVKAASRSHLPVACDASGGLDSSAIYCLAQQLRESGQLSTPAIHGYAFDFTGGGDADEMEYVHSITEHTGWPVKEIKPFLPELEWFSQRARELRDFAPFPNMVMATNVGRAAIADGCRVLLNGEGGDEWVGGREFYYAEMISEKDWRSVAKSFRADVADMGLRQSAWALFRWGIGPNLPAPIRALRQRLIAKEGPNSFDTAYWMTPEAAKRLSQRRQQFKKEADFKVANLPRRGMLWTMRDPFLEMIRSQISRQCATVGYEVRSPLYSRPYVEFAFATPERMRRRGGQRKYIHSKALADLLPPLIANRRTKSDFGIAFTRHLDTMRKHLIGLAEGVGSEFLDPRGVDRIIGEYHNADPGDGPIWELWGIFACEYMFEQGRADLPEVME